MLDKVFRRLGFKDDTGWDDPTVFGFVVLWGLIGYGFYVTIVELINKFTG